MGVGKVVDMKLNEAGQGDQKEKEMVVFWRAAVVKACEVDRKEDQIYVKVIISTAWGE